MDELPVSNPGEPTPSPFLRIVRFVLISALAVIAAGIGFFTFCTATVFLGFPLSGLPLLKELGNSEAGGMLFVAAAVIAGLVGGFLAVRQVIRLFR